MRHSIATAKFSIDAVALFAGLCSKSHFNSQLLPVQRATFFVLYWETFDFRDYAKGMRLA
jgi:hypothetical protein